MTNRYCFHADESFVNPMTREFQVVRITENEPGYTPVSENASLEFCRDTAAAMNREHGLSAQDVLDIRTSSMRAHLGTAHNRVSDLLGPEVEPPVRQRVLAIVGELEARLAEEAKFHFTVETEEGATFTPWTDGWAIGYKVTAPGKPDRWIFLNPSGADDLRETNAFVYVEDGDPVEGHEKLNCFHFYTIWDQPSEDHPKED